MPPSDTPPVRPVAVLTLNPSLDVSYEVSRLIPDQKAHASYIRYDPGGNGINLGQVLTTLGVRAETFCLVAGEIGLFLQRILEQELDAPHCIHIPGETRVNCTVIQAKPRIQYEVTADGPLVSSGALEVVEASLLHAAGDGYGVLTGSLPRGVPTTTYAALVRRLRAQGARAVVDARPEILREAVAARPFLIKPNRFEFEALCGRTLSSREDVIQQAREVQRAGVDWVCVSLGAEGAVLAGPHETYDAVPPPVTVRSTVGAGDSMLAGLVSGFARRAAPSETLRGAVACGSGTAEKPGTMLCTGEDAARVAVGVQVRRLEDRPAPSADAAPGPTGPARR